MKIRKQLSRFNFWSQNVLYRTCRGVQGVLKGVLSTDKHATSTCTSDQGGSQDGGGGSCNSDGTGGR